MKLAIFGSGYVGLVTGACFADTGNHVTCVDVDEAKIAGLKEGRIPIYEPGLEELIHRNSDEHRMEFTTDAAIAVASAEIIFIAVGTPPDEDGSADLKYVIEVASQVGRLMNESKIIVTKSTVPVGTADKVRNAVQGELDARGVELDFSVASNPEFLKEGAAIDDCMRPDRIVIGVDSEHARKRLGQLYAPYVKRNDDGLIFMDIRSAELTKYAANAMLATKISFMNELSRISEAVGADIESVRHGIGSDRRIGFHFIYPGAGYGGSCFPKDVSALGRTAEAHGVAPRLLDAVEETNRLQKKVMFEKINAHFDGQLEGKTIALWGLAFKPNTDDMREAPSRNLMEALWAAGASVQTYDPEAMEETQRIYSDVGADQLRYFDDPMAALEGADCLAVITEWKTFWNPDFQQAHDLLSYPVIFDGRNIYDPERLTELGFTYYSIGRVAAVPQ